MKTIREYIDLIENAQNKWVVYNLRGRIIKTFADEAEARQYAKKYGFYVKTQDIEEDQATAKMGLMSAMGSDSPDPAEQRRAMAQRTIEQLSK